MRHRSDEPRRHAGRWRQGPGRPRLVDHPDASPAAGRRHGPVERVVSGAADVRRRRLRRRRCGDARGRAPDPRRPMGGPIPGTAPSREGGVPLGRVVSDGGAVRRRGLAHDARRAGATLAERRTAGVWHSVRIPTPRGAAAVQLTGVACAASSFCFAVGYFTAAGVDVMLAGRGDGTRWVIGRARYPLRRAGGPLLRRVVLVPAGLHGGRVTGGHPRAERAAGRALDRARVGSPAGGGRDRGRAGGGLRDSVTASAGVRVAAPQASWRRPRGPARP